MSMIVGGRWHNRSVEFWFNILKGFRSAGGQNFRFPNDFAGHRYNSAAATVQPVTDMKPVMWWQYWIVLASRSRRIISSDEETEDLVSDANFSLPLNLQTDTGACISVSMFCCHKFSLYKPLRVSQHSFLCYCSDSKREDNSYVYL